LTHASAGFSLGFSTILKMKATHSYKIYGFATQKRVFFTVTAVTTSEPTKDSMCVTPCMTNARR
jgi:hypothetical protein